MSVKSFFGSDPLEIAAATTLLLVVAILAAATFATVVFLVGLTLGFDMSYMSPTVCPAVPVPPGR